MDQNQPNYSGPSKKCPECFTYMPLRATVCPACKVKVGKVDEHGKANRAFDWKGYAAAILSALAFAVYIWWAFFREHR
jgi:hypothetical protein